MAIDKFLEVLSPRDGSTRLVENKDIEGKAGISRFLDQFWKSSILRALKSSN